MRVYHPQGSSMMTMVTPGSTDKDCSEFFDDKGNARRFDVKFTNGVASVPDSVGKWLVAHGQANRTPIVAVKNRLLRA